jgi:transposase
MNQILAEFARLSDAGPSKRIVLVWDNSGWHTSHDLVLPDDIHLLPLPAHTPELQLAERLWPLVHETVANQAFSSIDALEARISERCRKLYAQMQTIHQHTCFHW